ncbi:MAG: hypothetical protein JXA14_15385 [Anaerolineae bacterium]|nr:hypothetical protein [Anaerolineae bacterium]
MRRYTRLIVIVVPMAVCSICQLLIPDFSTTEEIELVSHIGGVANAVAMQGDFLYAGFGSELAILDIFNPASPERTGYVVLPGIIEDIFIATDDPQGRTYAYVFVTSADPDSSFGTPRLQVVDVSLPIAPAVIREILLPGTVIGIVGHYIYAANWEHLKVVDVSDLAAPTETTVFSAPAQIKGMTVTDNRAYITWSVCYRAACTNGMSVLDISDPIAPKEIGSLDASVYLGTPTATTGDYVYIGYYDGLYVVDVSNPNEPVHAGNLETTRKQPTSIVVVDDRAYVAHADGFLTMLNISNPSSPVEMFAHQICQQIADMVVATGDSEGHTYTYATGGEAGGVQVVDISDPAAPTKIGRYGAPGEAASMAVADDRAYVVGTRGQLWIVDVSAPAEATQTGFYTGQTEDYSYFGGHVAIAANYAYVTTRTDMRVLDVSNPTHPIQVSSYVFPSGVAALAARDDYAYVATIEDTYDPFESRGALRMIDVSNPAAPLGTQYIITDPEAMKAHPTDVTAVGDYAYVTTSRGLWILHAPIQTNPSMVGIETPGSAMGVAVNDGYAYVADGFSGLRVFNVSDSTSPIDAGYVGIAGLTVDVAVGDGYVCALNEQEGLWVWDTSNPAAPTNPRNFYIPGRPAEVAVDGALVYVLDSVGGLYMLQR